MGYKDLGKTEWEDEKQNLGSTWTRAKPGQIYCSRCGSTARKPHGGRRNRVCNVRVRRGDQSLGK